MILRIHPEGRKFLTILGTASLVIVIVVAFFCTTWAALAAMPLAVLFLFFLQFFRNPVRTIAVSDNRIVYAPADGKVVSIEEVDEPECLNTRCLMISVFMSPFNVHVNRAPVGGEVTYFQYHPGKYLAAWHPKSSTENERTTLVIDNEQGRILVRQVAGLVARRIVWYIKPGQQLKQGQEYGFIKFGSRVDIYLPLHAEVLVAVNDTVKGNLTQLAHVDRPSA